MGYWGGQERCNVRACRSYEGSPLAEIIWTYPPEATLLDQCVVVIGGFSPCNRLSPIRAAVLVANHSPQASAHQYYQELWVSNGKYAS
jgi:hypothetical protein